MSSTGSVQGVVFNVTKCFEMGTIANWVAHVAATFVTHSVEKPSRCRPGTSGVRTGQDRQRFRIDLARPPDVFAGIESITA
jgi:hypothetical protein